MTSWRLNHRKFPFRYRLQDGSRLFFATVFSAIFQFSPQFFSFLRDFSVFSAIFRRENSPRSDAIRVWLQGLGEKKIYVRTSYSSESSILLPTAGRQTIFFRNGILRNFSTRNFAPLRRYLGLFARAPTGRQSPEQWPTNAKRDTSFLPEEPRAWAEHLHRSHNAKSLKRLDARPLIHWRSE